MIPKSGNRFSESDHAQSKSVRGRTPQLRIALRVDPVGALRRRGEEDRTLAAEGAAQFGARKQRRKPRLATGGGEAQPIDRASHHTVVDELEPGIAERAGNLEAQLLELARNVQAIAPALDGILNAHGAELGVDAVRRTRRGQTQLGNA